MKLLVISDLHHACAAEQARRGHESRAIGNPLLRGAARAWRRFVWLNDPFAHNHRLDQILAANLDPDLVVANGDFSLDTAFVGVSDEAARQSAAEVLERLRSAYGDRLHATIGDHELGKQSLFGGAGGPRWASVGHCLGELALRPCWRLDMGRHVLLGTTSTALAWPVFEAEARPEERPDWRRFHAEQLAAVAEHFQNLTPEQRVLLFVHDPTALPFLWQLEAVRKRLSQVEHTLIGHLHTRAVLRAAQLLAGVPRVGFLGVTVRRLTTALREARCWREFKVTLCPSPTGCELFKDGGWLEMEMQPDGMQPARIQFRPLPW